MTEMMTTLLMAPIGVTLASYLLGSIPFGLLLTRMAGLGDIRAIGSGNIGATNVLRTGNKKIAALTLVLDGLKGTVAVFLAGSFYPEARELMGLAAVAALLGHLFPIWLKFKGGKGVATTIGGTLALSPMLGLSFIVIWIVSAYLSKISSLSALLALLLTPLWAFFIAPEWALVMAIMSALGIFMHRANILRLLAGTEPKIGQS
jgi:acyl phosphate:glycerol-3-phosphate acyltransferase